MTYKFSGLLCKIFNRALTEKGLNDSMQNVRTYHKFVFVLRNLKVHDT